MEPFSLDAGAFCWINGEADDPEDLCLHGHAVARIAGETVEFDCAVSAAALYLLKSLTEDHLLGQGEQFFPCCGFFCIADEAGESVEIVGCDNGADWTVLHEGENVRLILPDGREQTLPLPRTGNRSFASRIRSRAIMRPARPRSCRRTSSAAGASSPSGGNGAGAAEGAPPGRNARRKSRMDKTERERQGARPRKKTPPLGQGENCYGPFPQ